MKNYNPWNNIPKNSNSNINYIDNNLSIDFNQKTTYLGRGEGRSYGDVCLNNNGTLLDTKNLNKVLNFDYINGFIECEAGITLSEILNFIIPKGWFLPVVPGTSFVTLGGAIANDIHGKNHHKLGSFGNFIEELTLLTSKKGIIKCSLSQNLEKYSATIGGLGLTGLIVSAKIKLIEVENDLVDSRSIRFSSLNEFFELNKKLEKSNDYTVSWVDINIKNKELRGVFHVGNHSKKIQNYTIKKNKKLFIKVPFLQRFSLVNNLTINILNNFYFWINKSNQLKIKNYRSFFFPLDIIKNWNKAYGVKGFYQYQFVVPLENSKSTLKEVINIVSKYKQRPVLSVLKTFGRVKSLGMLSFPQEGLTLAMDFQNKGTKTLNMLKDLDKVILKYNGRIYIAKDSRVEKSEFHKFYSNFVEFSKFIDPKFNSTFLNRIN